MTGNALYWYGSIWLFLFLTGLGLPPMPEEAGILYAAGLHALHPEVMWWGAWPAAGLGILCADCILYGLGRRFGVRLFEYKWVQRILSQERRLRLEGKIHEHGMKLLIMARFLPPLRTGVFLISGAARYPFVKFLTADLIYCVVGVGVFFFGGTWLVELLKHVGHAAVWLVAVPAVAYGLYRYYRYLKQKEIAASAVPAVATAAAPTNPAGAAPALREAKTMLQEG